jgi:release factor glutamine methyltransferase
MFTWQKSKIRVELDHFQSRDYKLFYEPSDDTWLFTDALEQEANHIVQLLNRNKMMCHSNHGYNSSICVEVGSGSGYVTTFLYKLLKTFGGESLMHSIYFLCTDINPNATNATWRTIENNRVNVQQIDVIQTNFVDALMYRLKNKVDVLLFNPPYVPSTQEEVRIFLVL